VKLILFVSILGVLLCIGILVASVVGGRRNRD
jgi:hypothetical protein